MLAKVLAPIVVLIAACIVALALALSRPEAKQQSQPPERLLVETLEAVRALVTFVVAAQGEVTPRTETLLISEVSGRILSVSPSFVSGGFFKQGELLARIDPRIYDSRLKQAQVNVARAKTQVATENALAGYAFRDWKRLRELDAATESPSALTLRKPQLATALAELESAEAALKEAEGDLQRTFIRAPYEGMLREKRSDLGQYVKPGDPLARTFAIDYAEVRLPLNQNDLAFLDLPERPGAPPVPVTLTAKIAGTEHRWLAAITRTEGVFDARSRVLYAVAQVQDPYGLAEGRAEPLRMGTFVNAEIQGKRAGPLFAVPRHALHRGTTVWLVDGNSALRPVEVRVLRADTEHAYVDQGLSQGDRICITPMEQPFPGMPVRAS